MTVRPAGAADRVVVIAGTTSAATPVSVAPSSADAIADAIADCFAADAAERRGRRCNRTEVPRWVQRAFVGTGGYTPEEARAAADAARRSLVGGRATVITPAGNGGRPVLVYVPPGCDPRKPVTVVTYLHGIKELVGANLVTKGWIDFLRRHQAALAAKNVVFVFPQGPLDANNGAWLARRKKESFADVRTAALASAFPGADVVPSAQIVVAHSGGGSAVKNALDARELVAGGETDLFLLDAIYGQTATAIPAGLRGHRVSVGSYVVDAGERHAADYRLFRAELAKVGGGRDLSPQDASHGKLPNLFLKQGGALEERLFSSRTERR